MSTPRTAADLPITSKNLKALTDGHLEDTGGLLRLTPTGVPRFLLQPDLRTEFHPDNTIDESGTGINGKSMWEKYRKSAVHSKLGPEVNPDASTLAA